MSTTTYAYPFDPTGQATTNLITGERQILTPPNWSDFYFILPLATPFFANNKFQLILQPSGKILVEGVDFVFCFRFYDASSQSAAPVYGGVYFMDKTLSGVLELQYQTIGGAWTLDTTQIATVLANQLLNPLSTTWEEIVSLPFQFPPVSHPWDLVDMVGASDIVNVLNQIVTALLETGSSGLATHLADFNNPHRVTATQVLLGNVQNYSVAVAADAVSGSSNALYMTPAMTLVEINTFAVAPLNTHLANVSNPHNVTAAQVGLGSVVNASWASTVDAQTGTTAVTYMNPALTAAAIAYQALAPLNTHLANLSNPHQVNSTQVGLGNVANYPIATLAQAQAATDNASYMTPYLVSQLLGGTSGIAGQLQTHIDNLSNPHQVTATQVGLGSVLNYGMASDADAQAGSSAILYMAPSTTLAAITAQLAPYAAHISNISNPHAVTAVQVGLGSVQNYGMATDTDATTGTSSVLYMAPSTTLTVITAQLVPYAAHVADITTNPHQVTAAQVGLGSVQNYGMATNVDATAGTSAILYMAPLTTAEAISGQVGNAFNAHVVDYSNPHQVTAAQVGAYTTAYIDTQLAAIAAGYLPVGGTAVNSNAVGGQSLSQIIATVNGGVPASTKIAYAPVNSVTHTGTTWTAIYAELDYTPDPTFPYLPIVALIQGGEARGDEANSPTYYLYFDPLYPAAARVECLAGDASAIQFGYVPNATGGASLYAYSPIARNAISMLMISDPLVNDTALAGVVSDTAPTGLVYLNQVIADPTVVRAKPSAGEVTVGSGFNASPLSTGYANGPSNHTQFATPVQFLSVATTTTEETSAAAIQTQWASEWRHFDRVASYGTEPYRASAVSLYNVWGWDNTASAIEFTGTAEKVLQTLLSPEPIVPGQPYQIEVEVSSTDLGDESIGLCLGYVIGDGQPYGLWAVRTPGATVVEAQAGTLPGSNMSTFGLFTVGLNLFQTDGQVVAANTAALTWGDGVLGSTDRTATPYVPNATTAGTNGWANKGTVRIRYTFDGTTCTVETTDFNDTTGTYVAGATLTFALSSLPFNSVTLAGYPGGSSYGGYRWGLATFNQLASEFKVLTSPDYYARYAYYNPGVDGTDSSILYFYSGNPANGSSGWMSLALPEYTIPGRVVYSDVNNTLWMTRRDGTLTPMPVVAYTGTAGTQILTT